MDSLTVVTVKNSPIEHVNGEYHLLKNLRKSRYASDKGTPVYVKDNEHQIYRHRLYWRIAHSGKKLYHELNMCVNGQLNVSEIDFAQKTRNAINLGVMIYSNNCFANASSNIGDWVQSLAALGIYKKIVEGINGTTYDFEDYVDKVLSNSIPNFNFIFIKRDNMDDMEQYMGYENIITIMNGWWLHPSDTYGNITFTIPSCVKPIFISFHIGEPKLLNAQNIKVFKRYEPIGCRDKKTTVKLQKKGVKAYFSGCLTTTIDFFSWNRKTNNVYVVDTAITDEEIADGIGIRDEDYERFKNGETLDYDIYRPDNFTIKEISHADPSYKNIGIYGFKKAVSLLKGYTESAGSVTSRLHCYLPCLAMGVPADFRSPFGERGLKSWEAPDRFDGLRELNDRLKLLKMRNNVMRLAVSRCMNEVYKIYGELTFISENPSMKRIRGYNTLEDLSPSQTINICFCSDRNLANFIPTVMNTILTHNWHHKINVFYINDITDENDLQIVREYMNGLENVTYTEIFKTWDMKYNGLNHVTAATMLRIFIPELIDVARILYLDIDIVVHMDLANIFNQDVGRKGIGLKNSIDPNWSKLANGVTSGNAGIMMMDLIRLRELNFTLECLQIHSKNSKEHDQWIINKWLEGHHVRLLNNWNTFLKQDDHIVFENYEYILHYAGSHKPYYKNSGNFQYLWDAFE